MKTGIHPEMYDVVFVDISSGDQFIAQSTTKSDETVKIDGKEYYVIKVEISSATHPFYTGKQKLLDSSGRVDKFKQKRAAAEKRKAEEAAKLAEENGEEQDEEVEEVKEEAKTPAEPKADEPTEAPEATEDSTEAEAPEKEETPKEEKEEA